MYSWIWRILPGNSLAKAITSLVLVVGMLALLWFVIFPYAEPLLPFGDVTVDGADTTSAP